MDYGLVNWERLVSWILMLEESLGNRYWLGG